MPIYKSSLQERIYRHVWRLNCLSISKKKFCRFPWVWITQKRYVYIDNAMAHGDRYRRDEFHNTAKLYIFGESAKQNDGILRFFTLEMGESVRLCVEEIK